MSSTRVLPPRKLVPTPQATSWSQGCPVDPGFQGPPQAYSEYQRLAASLNLPWSPTTPQPQPGGRPVAHLSVPLLETLLASPLRASDREGRKPGFSGPCKSLSRRQFQHRPQETGAPSTARRQTVGGSPRRAPPLLVPGSLVPCYWPACDPATSSQYFA